jgi:hypothetical protein
MQKLGLALVVLAACGTKGEDKPKATPGAIAEASLRDAAPVAKPPAQAKRPEPIPPEKRREYAGHLKSGRAHAKGKRWGEAALEFEKALAAVPMDDRALSELGWAALQAGDLDKAEKANADSVRVSSTPEVKAASLYNLGRVAEAKDDKERAAALYADSLVLRPSKTVVKRLAALGKQAPAAGPDQSAADTPCKDPVEGPDLVCGCLKKIEPYEEGFEVECTIGSLDDIDDEDLRIASVTLGLGEHSFYLAQKGAKGWSVIGSLGDLYEGGVGGVSNEREEETIEEKTIGGVRILWYQWSTGGHDTDMGIDEVSTYGEKMVALAVLAGDKDPPSVRMHIPLERVYDRDRLGVAEEGDLADVKDMMTKGLPIHHESHLKVDIREDGTVVVVLNRGEADESLKPFLGSHRLFTPAK